MTPLQTSRTKTLPPPSRSGHGVSLAALRVTHRLARRLAPPPRLTLSQWADQFRRLSPESSAEPGRWDTSRAEYQRGMMDALTDPRVERVVLMTSARVGKTQCLNNLVGFHIHQDPAPMLIVLPTEVRAEEWADDELDPMIRDTPALRAIMGDRKSRQARQVRLRRNFPGGRLYAVGANAPSGLAAKTVRIVLADEVDRFPASAGEEGDPITLAEKRTATIWNRKIVLSSTPTNEGTSRIAAAYAASDRRRFWVPCPHCKEHQTLKWEHVEWTGDDPGSAFYYCAACGVEWTDAERWQAVSRGEWRAEGAFTGTAGFHLNELYSPWRRLAETVRDFQAAEALGPEGRKVFRNTALGETWRERGDAPDWERLLDRREPWPMGEAPEGVLALTIGADLQGDRIEAALWGWGRGLRRWLIDTAVFHGRPADAAPWDALAVWAQRDIRCAGGGTLRAVKVGVDTGGQDTTAAYGHIRRLGLPHLMVPLKGVDRWGGAAPVQGPTPVDAKVNGKTLRRGLRIWTVSVSTFKAELYRALWLKRGDDGETPDGWVHLPQGLDAEQAKQLVAEQLQTVRDKRGFSRQEWAKLRDRNEQLDMAVYARAALWVAGADRMGARFWDELSRRHEAAVLAPAAPVDTPAPSVPDAHRAPAPVAAPRPAPRPAPRGYFGGWR